MNPVCRAAGAIAALYRAAEGAKMEGTVRVRVSSGSDRSALPAVRLLAAERTGGSCCQDGLPTGIRLTRLPGYGFAFANAQPLRSPAAARCLSGGISRQK